MCPRIAKRSSARASAEAEAHEACQPASAALPHEANNNEARHGWLYIVPTPIGNIADISLRALDVLKIADMIAAEDPVVTRRLLNHYRIPTRAVAYAGRQEQTTTILSALSIGQTVAYLCDAGTPGIADPGAALIDAAIVAGHRVLALPGPVAAIVALIASGLPPHRFAFDGFPPRGRTDREAFFTSLSNERRTLILYESARYLRSTLASLHRCLHPDCRIAIASDLTTTQETIWRGNLAEAMEWMNRRVPRGSYTLVLDCAR